MPDALHEQCSLPLSFASYDRRLNQAAQLLAPEPVLVELLNAGWEAWRELPDGGWAGGRIRSCPQWHSVPVRP